MSCRDRIPSLACTDSRSGAPPEVSPRSCALSPCPAATALPACSADTLFNGALICHQPLQGYRFSVDALLLAHYSTPQRDARVLDLGCGCGVVALILAYRHPHCRVCALEYQGELAALARANVIANGLQDRVQVLEADLRCLRGLIEPESFELVLANPPYYSRGRGRISRNSQEALARHDLAATLADFVDAAAFAVKNRGRATFIFPAQAQAQVQRQLLEKRLVPKRLQLVYSHPTAPGATLLLVETVKNGGEGCRVLPPFYLYARRGGVYSPALRALYQEEPCWPRC